MGTKTKSEYDELEFLSYTETMQTEPQIDWTTSLFLIITPVLALVAAPIYVALTGWRWELLVILGIFAALSNLSITAGYHRFLSHQSYQANKWVKLFYLLFGAGAFQGSALKWASDHRRHHRYCDTDKDPYNIGRGFFFAHMGWLFVKDDPRFRGQFAPDLKKDPMVMWQHNHYVWIASFMCFILPMLAGLALGIPIGGFIFGGIVKVVFTHHTTFFINSICHMFGSQTYGKKYSAKDAWWIAFLTHGEGYHNFHHHFQADYRNGIRWFDWDPTKWFIQILNLAGLATKLKTVSDAEILRMRIQEDYICLQDKAFIAPDVVQSLQRALTESLDRWKTAKENYHLKKRDRQNIRAQKMVDLKLQWKSELKSMKKEMRIAQRQLHAHLRAWSSIRQAA